MRVRILAHCIHPKKNPAQKNTAELCSNVKLLVVLIASACRCISSSSWPPLGRQPVIELGCQTNNLSASSWFLWYGWKAIADDVLEHIGYSVFLAIACNVLQVLLWWFRDAFMLNSNQMESLDACCFSCDSVVQQATKWYTCASVSSHNPLQSDYVDSQWNLERTCHSCESRSYDARRQLILPLARLKLWHPRCRQHPGRPMGVTFAKIEQVSEMRGYRFSSPRE